MDCSKLSDVELTQRYLDAVKQSPPPRRVLASLEVEGRCRGHVRMAVARKALGAEREAERTAQAVLP